jgi:putative DNA primase/helicase
VSNVIELIPEADGAKLVRPCYRVYDHGTTLDGVKLRPGVWFHGTKSDGEDDRPTNEWLCGPLHVEAITRSESKDADYGRLLRFRNMDNRELTWAMPGELLAGRPEAILSVLFGMGLEVEQRRRARVVEYIAGQHPRKRITAATATGWHGAGLFITPLENIGNGEAIYQADNADSGDYGKAGTLAGWREGIGAMLPGNPLLQLAIGTALAGPLLVPLNIHAGGGFHLLWDSSNGKTTAVYCAASTWGHGFNFALKWNATANGLEGIAALRNDGLLALDELGQADGRYVGDVVYSVADGIGKQRAGRTGSARKVRRWRVMLLSSGEVTLETKMAEAGKRTRAGQEVRLVTVSAGRTFGAWDNLHDYPSGEAMSDGLKGISSTHYGHAGPEFVRELIARGELDSLPAMLGAIKAHFPAESGQSARVAERFAIVALALELAVGVGLPADGERRRHRQHGRAVQGLAGRTR